MQTLKQPGQEQPMRTTRAIPGWAYALTPFIVVGLFLLGCNIGVWIAPNDETARRAYAAIWFICSCSFLLWCVEVWQKGPTARRSPSSEDR